MLAGMPSSRKRRRRAPLTQAQLKQRRQRERRQPERELVATLRPGQSLEHLLTEDDHAAMEAEMNASARGDARLAWEHHMSGLVVEESMHRHRLREIVDLGGDAPGWVYSRWCLDQAYRWMLVSRDLRADDMVRVVLGATHLDHVEQLMDRPTALTEYGTLVAASDWLTEQLCLYTAGGLRDFLDVRAEPGLLEHADLVREWAGAWLGVHQLEEIRGPALVVRNLVDNAVCEVLNLGAFNERSPDVALGRVVPISTPPFHMFDSRPVPLDPETALHAAEVMRGPDELAWLDALSAGRDAGRLQRGFSCTQQTMYSSDLVVELPAHEPHNADPPGRMRELLAAGLDEHVANGVMVAEVALIAARVSDGAAAVVAPHLATALVDSRVFAAVLTHCAGEEQEGPWRRLAASTWSPVRERCLEIAKRSGPHAA